MDASLLSCFFLTFASVMICRVGSAKTKTLASALM